MDKNTIKNIQQSAKVIAPIESYDLSKDKRLLIPFVYGEELGFFNQDLDVVVSPKYITYHGECYGKEDYVVTVKRIPCYLGYTNIYFYGIIDYQGKEDFPQNTLEYGCHIEVTPCSLLRMTSVSML